MADAIRIKAVPEVAALREGARKNRDRRTSFKGRRFKDLSQKEKDRLLKAVAIQLGLLDAHVNEDD